jgi:Fuc2NAc and GlcNAc transferase
MPIYITIPVILFFMVWMMNAYNFIDGIDGMAASGAIFVSITLALVLFLTDGPIEIVAIFILVASTVIGFILFNWPPATIFMGDAGSVFLGYIFGSLLLFTVLNNDISIWSWITVFGYFFADTTVTQIMRVILVKKWYLAHRSHAYQNLARITGSHLKVTGAVILYNIIWIFPLVVWSVLQPEMEVVAAILAVAPAMIVTYKYGPLLSSS